VGLVPDNDDVVLAGAGIELQELFSAVLPSGSTPLGRPGEHSFTYMNAMPTIPRPTTTIVLRRPAVMSRAKAEV